MKRTLTIVACLLVALSLAAEGGREGSAAAAGAEATPAVAPSGYPIVKERITVKVMNSKNQYAGPWGDAMSFLREMKELTNIDFVFSDIPESDWATKMNLSLAAGDLPDVYMSPVGIENVYNYGVKGKLFVNFADKVEQYMPLLRGRMKKYPDMLKIVTQPDGGIYSFPKILITATSGKGNLYVRTDYMKTAGVSQEPATLDEFTGMLRAIKGAFASDPKFVILLPHTVAQLNGHYEQFMFGAMGDYVTAGFNVDAGGKVFYNGVTDQFYRYLEYTNKLYAEKILYNEVYSIDAATSLAMIQNGKAALTTFGTNYGMPSFPSGKYDVALLGPLTSSYSPTRKLVAPDVLSDSTVVITRNCKYPEAMLRWFDTLYSEEDVSPGLNSVSPFLGIRGEEWDYTDDTRQYWKRLIEYTSQGVMTYREPQNYLGLDFMAIAAGGSAGNIVKGRDTVKKVYPYIVEPFPLTYLKFTDAEMGQYTTMMTDINTYVDQMKAKFITGVEPLANFKSYVANLEKMRLNETVRIVQAAYDRFRK